VRDRPPEGLLLGLPRTTTEMVGDNRRETLDTRFADWNRVGRNWRNRLRLERRLRDFTVTGLRNDDAIVYLDSGVQLSETWNWSMSGRSFDRELEAVSLEPRDTSYRTLRTRFVRQSATDQHFEIQGRAGRYETGGIAPLQAQGATVASPGLLPTCGGPRTWSCRLPG
jgi:hypothetical protein